MVRENWKLTKSRQETIQSLREKGRANLRLPDFLNEAQEDIPSEESNDKISFKLAPETDEGLSEASFFFKNLPQGGILFVMNKISFLSIVLGLLFMGILLYGAGILTAYYILPGGPRAIGVAIQGGKGGDLPKIDLPTKEDITRSIEKAIGALGEAPKKQDVERAVQTAVKAITPEIAQSAVNKMMAPSETLNQEFIDGAKKIPGDSDAGRFTVQAKIYGDGAWAMQLARKLKEEGYGAYIVRVKEAPGNIQRYHTRVGVFGDYMAANSMVRSLKEMGNRSATVVLIARGEDRVVP